MLLLQVCRSAQTGVTRSEFPGGKPLTQRQQSDCASAEASASVQFEKSDRRPPLGGALNGVIAVATSV